MHREEALALGLQNIHVVYKDGVLGRPHLENIEPKQRALTSRLSQVKRTPDKSVFS